MRYLVDVTQKQVDEINHLISAGKYQAVAQFISTAIENQIYLENSETFDSNIKVSNKNDNILKKATMLLADCNRQITLSEVKSQPKIVPMPSFSELSASLYKAEEEKCWLWGQTNKILPVKIGLRMLLSVLGSEQWTYLEEYRNLASEVAAKFGSIIRKYEEKENKIRDEKISAGLPEEKEYKSKFRYKGHFLAYMRKDSKLEGAMPFLRFANLKKDDKDKILIGITEPGLRFAKLENSVIDLGNFNKSLTDKEVDFYLAHISENAKGESAAIKWLLNKLLAGINERELINKELFQEMGVAWGKPSPEVVNTQRAGLMARMFELGLIEKVKDGIKVKYNISPVGNNFLKRK